jgi:hypothetical protein
MFTQQSPVQGDHIGRFFTLWAILYFDISKIKIKTRQTSSLGNRILGEKISGNIFGDFLQNHLVTLSRSPAPPKK